MSDRDATIEHKGDQFLVLTGQSAMIGQRVGDANHLGVHLASEFLLCTLNGERRNGLLFMRKHKESARFLNNFLALIRGYREISYLAVKGLRWNNVRKGQRPAG